MEYCNLGKNDAQKEEKISPDQWADFFQWPFTETTKCYGTVDGSQAAHDFGK